MGNGPSKIKFHHNGKSRKKCYNTRRKSSSSLSSCSSSTASRQNSATSSDNDFYRFSYGRRYQNVENVNYFMPNDEDEMARLQLLHYLVKLNWNSDFSSPITERLKFGNFKVLDCGCGPGTWVMELGSEYPNSHFIGIDCCPIFPTSIKPANVEFQCTNLLNSLPFDDDTFDFVHMRFMVGSFTSEQWESIVIPELMRVCKPGGFLECMESDMKWVNSGPATDPYLQEYLRRTDRLVNINHAHRNIPIGGWAGKLGESAFQVAQQTFEASKIHLSEFLEISHDEYDELIRIACREFDQFQTMVPTFRFWAQKI
ncbi:9816_t:CDS:2 [Ambispora gerdemannii]|uniref:9816_t:CDS:1 n=1 Tax=Ambispora gerdemannii TaxID=144530 RepID=A0A9N9BAM2_9GLOM|nr:9816_t:CDS:2 [Ambispora gerdemannii]